MTRFSFLIDYVMAAGLLFSILMMYFQVNKLWHRKHEAAVVDAISLFTCILGILYHIPLALAYFLLDYTFYAGLNAIVITIGLIFIFMIGAGHWVDRHRKRTVFGQLFHTLKREYNESGQFIMSFRRPAGAEKIVTVLMQLSAIDDHIHEKEIELIHNFAKKWNIALPDLKVGTVEHLTSITELRESVQEYLQLSPPFEQAGAVDDLLKTLMEVDGHVHEKELLIYEELKGAIDEYVLGDEGLKKYFEVVLVPQNREQFYAVYNLFPHANIEDHRGGEAFVVGRFFARNYAEAISQKYIHLGLYSSVEEFDPRQSVDLPDLPED